MEKSIFPEAEKKILQMITDLSGSYTPYVIFSDWVKMMAMTIQNTCDQYHGEHWKKREKAYLEVVAKYTDQEIKKMSYISMREPSIGGGGMVLAAAKVLLEKGINYQRCLDVVGQDLDWNGVYMAYVQLSVIGIRATLYQGDSLQEGVIFPENTLYTPARMGVLI